MPETLDILWEIAKLEAMLIASEAHNRRRDERIERLEKLVAAFRQAAFGQRSEKGDPDQFGLLLEDLETAIAVAPTKAVGVRNQGETAQARASDRSTMNPAKAVTDWEKVMWTLYV